jgi:pimeloyl-[acyl-carrier protein] methyl ester esterase
LRGFRRISLRWVLFYIPQDLDLLGRCDGMLAGFPSSARVLIVEAEEDRIVEPEARRMLREALPDADVITLPGVGHALLSSEVIARMVEWAEMRG